MDDAAQAVWQVLRNPALAGAVVSGPSGSGRRAAVDTAHEHSGTSMNMVRLNGSSFGRNVPLGVLSLLLAQLDLDSEVSRHELVHGLGRLLCPDDRPSLVVLGHPELVDEESGSLLAQLAAMKKIKLVVVCALVQDLPRDLLALLRSGQLEQVTVNRMNAAQTRLYLEAKLGSPLSVLATATLQALSNSNRGIMLRLARIWINHQQLVLRSGIWVLTSAAVPSGPDVKTLLNSMTSGLDDAERNLLCAMALAGPVSMEAVHRAGLTSAMDGLIGTGHVAPVPKSANRFEITVPILGLALGQDMDPGQSSRALTLVERLHVDPHAAQTHTAMRNLADAGQLPAMVQAGEQFATEGYTAERWATCPFLRLNILKLHVRALRHLGRSREAMGVVEDAAAALAQASGAQRDNFRLLRTAQEVQLLTDGLSLLGGAPDPVEHDAQLLSSAEIGWMTEGLRLRSLSYQAARWAASDRQDDALDVVAHVTRTLQTLRLHAVAEGGLCPDDLVETESLMLLCELLGGSYHKAQLRATELASGKYASPRMIAHAEMVRGILFAIQDDHERALLVLEPCLRQLEVDEPSAARTAVDSVVNYLLAASGRGPEATAQAVPKGNDTSPVTGYLGLVAAAFAALTLAQRGAAVQAQQDMLDFADRARSAGRFVLEMHAVAFAWRLGAPAAERVRSTAAACQGKDAAGYRQLADAVGNNSDAVVNALVGLAESGNSMLSGAADNALVKGLDLREQRKLSKLVNAFKQPKPGGGSGADTEQPMPLSLLPSWTQELTKRESEVARMAISGKTNLQIAKYNGVSIRTVEGHLYQVYSKLQVRNRQELTALDRSSRRAAGQQ